MLESMQETLNVERSIKKHPWLIEMVKSKQFHEFCDQHTTKWRSYFCSECMVPPLCFVCSHKDDHKGHLMIQVFRSSRQPGVEIKTLSKYMDISGIHAYKINKNTIFYIHQRGEDNDHRGGNNVSGKCKGCEWGLDVASLFCSIQCKFKSALGSKLDELMESCEENKSNSDITETSTSTSGEVLKKKRRHRRKGTPHKVPYYGTSEFLYNLGL